eukprot:3445107-Rhodomonas_salina.1
MLHRDSGLWRSASVTGRAFCTRWASRTKICVTPSCRSTSSPEAGPSGTKTHTDAGVRSATSG